jgi:hypothetical protein
MLQDTAMRKCTKAERLVRTAENRVKADERSRLLKETYLRNRAQEEQGQ